MNYPRYYKATGQGIIYKVMSAQHYATVRVYHAINGGISVSFTEAESESYVEFIEKGLDKGTEDEYMSALTSAVDRLRMANVKAKIGKKARLRREGVFINSLLRTPEDQKAIENQPRANSPHRLYICEKSQNCEAPNCYCSLKPTNQ